MRRFIVDEKAAFSRGVLIHQRAEHQVRDEHRVQCTVRRITFAEPRLALVFFSLFFFLKELFHASALLAAGCIKMSLFWNISRRAGRGAWPIGYPNSALTFSCWKALKKPNWGEKKVVAFYQHWSFLNRTEWPLPPAVGNGHVTHCRCEGTRCMKQKRWFHVRAAWWKLIGNRKFWDCKAATTAVISSHWSVLIVSSRLCVFQIMHCTL